MTDISNHSLTLFAQSGGGHSTRPETGAQLPYGDIPALQALGLLPVFVQTQTVSGAVTPRWDSGGGDRESIGLFPEDHAACIAGQSNLLPDILTIARDPCPQSAAYSTNSMMHCPNQFWFPYLMTGDQIYIDNMENHWSWHQKYYGNRPLNQGIGPSHYGRGLAWSMRDICILGYLDDQGLTTQSGVYTQARESSFSWLEANRNNAAQRYDTWRIFSFDYLTGDPQQFDWTGWMESMVGLSLCYCLMLGNTRARELLEWQYEHLERRSGDGYPFKGLDCDHMVFAWADPTATSYADMEAIADTETWATLGPWQPGSAEETTYDGYPDNELPACSGSGQISYSERVEYALQWATMASNLQIDSRAPAKAQQIRDAIAARNTRDSYTPIPKNKMSIKPESGYNYGALPLNRWVSTGIAPVTEITNLLAANGFDSSKWRGSVNGSFYAWVGAAHDFDEDQVFIPWGGGHGDSSLNGIWKLNLTDLSWAIESMPSDPQEPGYEWSDTYWNSNNYTVYQPAGVVTPKDSLPNGKVTSRHHYGGVWVDSKRGTIQQSRITLWTYNKTSKALGWDSWVKPDGTAIEMAAPGDNLFYDRTTDRVYGTVNGGDYSYYRFIEYNPDDNGQWHVEYGAEFSYTPSVYCVAGRKIFGFGNENTEKWSSFDMDTKAKQSGVLTGGVSYTWSEEMGACVYIPEWGKILRQFMQGANRGNWYLFDINSKVQEPYTPVGDVPLGTWVGNKCFYYPAKKTVVYVEVNNTGVGDIKLMRVG